MCLRFVAPQFKFSPIQRLQIYTGRSFLHRPQLVILLCAECSQSFFFFFFFFFFFVFVWAPPWEGRGAVRGQFGGQFVRGAVRQYSSRFRLIGRATVFKHGSTRRPPLIALFHLEGDAKV